MKKIVFLLVLMGIVATAKVKYWIFDQENIQESVQMLVNKGASVGSIAKQLKVAGVIDKPWLFKLVARYYGLEKSIKAGEYKFDSKISMYEVINKMARGEVFYRKITLPEGLTTKQILDIIQADDNLYGDITINTQEGELLPETYSFVYGDTKNSVILQAKESMKNALNEVWERRDKTIKLKNKEQLLVLASIIEKETGVAEERELVASVFANRLRKGMKLQTDPTVIYALTLGQRDLGRLLTRKDLEIDSPYNTYRYYGLPPKPICNPGIESIKAAANPELSDFLYFVANGKGGHNFAKSLNEHNINVKNWKKKAK